MLELVNCRPFGIAVVVHLTAMLAIMDLVASITLGTAMREGQIGSRVEVQMQWKRLLNVVVKCLL